MNIRFPVKPLAGFALALAFGLGLPSGEVLAQAAAVGAQADETVATSNRIENLQVTERGGSTILQLTLAKPLAAVPASFSVAAPARIAFDFPDTGNGLGRSSQVVNVGELRSANIVQVGDRTRLVLNLGRLTAYDTQLDGRELRITLAPPAAPAVAQAGSPAASSGAFAPAPVGASGSPSIRDINFRRGRDGEARLLVDLSDPNTGIDIRQQGANLVVEFQRTQLPEQLRRRLDVVDFGTPVTSIVTQAQGDTVRMTVTPRGLWEHNAYQSDNQFVLEVKPVKEDPNRLVQGAAGKGRYAGEKLSLNFQNIDVRSVLQVIADFTNFNIITSDSVQGNLTLRLKDVPWDQALDIILQARGLDMRKTGNVIWIAPRDELAAREKLELESRAQIGDLEPLRTESFQINYHRARAVAELLRSKDQTILSKRGTVTVDERSNKLFVNDVAGRLEDIRRLLAEIDIQVRQVLIEAQIVEAADTFARNLGVRLGFGARTGGVIGTNTTTDVVVSRNTIGGGLSGTGYRAGQIETKPDFFRDTMNVNLPASSINNKQAGALSFALWNSAATRFLDLEVSALEADGRGKIVSRPRVMTADQAEAIIEQGVEIPYNSATSSGATSVSFRKANLALRVKPQITPDGKVMMALDINKDSPRFDVPLNSGIPIDTKHVRTEVIVDNGGTIVIGGIYQQDASNNTTKIPLLGDIPGLGYLFRNNERKDNKSELLVFITPRILNEQLGLR